MGSLKAKADTKEVKFMMKNMLDLQGKNVLANKNVGDQQKACLRSSLHIAYRPRETKRVLKIIYGRTKTSRLRRRQDFHLLATSIAMRLFQKRY